MKNLATYQKFFALLLLSLIPFAINAQAIRGFGSASLYSANDGFYKDMFKQIEIGVDYDDGKDFSDDDKIISPQVSVSYFSGKMKDKVNYDYENYVQEIMSKKAKAVNLGIGLKFHRLLNYLFENEGNGFSVYLMPKLNIARITATGYYSLDDYFEPSNSVISVERVQKWRVYGSLDAGMEFYLSESSYTSIALNLTVSRLNFGKAFNELQYDNSNYGKFNFGVGLSYYFGLKKFNKNSN